MAILFTANDIRKVLAKMKLIKCPGCGEIWVELIKYAPDRIHEQIAKIYKNMAEAKEQKYGILTPLQKPNNAKGPPSNLRPVILISSLRKTLAACITNRIKDRLEAKIPPSQATYRPNRSTTEHIFTSKPIIERTITARNESARLIMLGISKAFNSINRNQLIEGLQDIIETDELHIISALLNVSLSVRCENTLSKVLKTDTGVPQENCASALQFTY